jgi:hypothetical protein
MRTSLSSGAHQFAKWPPAFRQEMAAIFKMAACIWSRDGLHFQNGRLHFENGRHLSNQKSPPVIELAGFFLRVFRAVWALGAATFQR